MSNTETPSRTHLLSDEARYFMDTIPGFLTELSALDELRRITVTYDTPGPHEDGYLVVVLTGPNEVVRVAAGWDGEPGHAHLTLWLHDQWGGACTGPDLVNVVHARVTGN